MFAQQELPLNMPRRASYRSIQIIKLELSENFSQTQLSFQEFPSTTTITRINSKRSENSPCKDCKEVSYRDIQQTQIIQSHFNTRICYQSRRPLKNCIQNSSRDKNIQKSSTSISSPVVNYNQDFADNSRNYFQNEVVREKQKYEEIHFSPGLFAISSVEGFIKEQPQQPCPLSLNEPSSALQNLGRIDITQNNRLNIQQEQQIVSSSSFSTLHPSLKKPLSFTEEDEIVDKYLHIQKSNVIKNILNSFKKYASDMAYKSKQNDDTAESKRLESISKSIKRNFRAHGSRWNLIVKSLLISKVFKDEFGQFLDHINEFWLSNSKVVNKQDHIDAALFLRQTIQNPFCFRYLTSYKKR